MKLIREVSQPWRTEVVFIASNSASGSLFGDFLLYIIYQSHMDKST